MKKGWEIREIGDVLALEYGKPLPEEKRISEGKYPVYGANGIKGRTNEYYHNKKSIVVGRKGSAGEVNLTEDKFWPLDVTYYIKYDESKYFLKFLYYLLKLLELPKLAKGVKPGINRNDVYAFRCYFPMLTEQKQIASILDETFEAIEKAKANAERNLENARELFESYLESIFKNKGDEWEEKELSEIYDVRDGTHDSPKYHAVGFTLITSKNLKKDKLDYDNVKYISEKDYININKRSKVDEGDVLFAMIGTIGNPVVIKNEPNFAIKNVALFKVPKNQNSYFLKYFLDAKSTMDKMLSEAKGSTQKFVGLGYLRSFKIFLPSLNEQISIVNKLKILNTEINKLESNYQKKIEDLDELKKSILQKAFNGELITSNSNIA